MRHGVRTSFLFQAGLILLPTVILAVVGFYLVQRDRESVIQEARQHAEQLAPGIAEFVGNRLVPQMQDDLRDLLQHREQFGENNPDLQMSRGSSDGRSDFEVPMEEFWALKESVPDSNYGHVFDGAFSWITVIGNEGQLLAPKPYHEYPRPNLGDQTIRNEERGRIEQKIRKSLSGTNEISDFKSRIDPEISSQNAPIIYELANTLYDEGETGAASNLFALLSKFDTDSFTYSGLPIQPLANLSLARIRGAELHVTESKTDRSSYRSILNDLGKSAIIHPSSLSEPIFNFIEERLASESQPGSPQNQDWRSLWLTLNSTIDFQRALTGSNSLKFNNDGVPTAHWLRWKDMDWWVGFSAAFVEEPEPQPRQSIGVFAFSSKSIELAIPELFDMGEFLLPAGVGLEFLISGRRIGGTETALEHLATASADIIVGGPYRYENFAGYFEERPVGELVTRIVITQPDVLLALQRERSRWLFGIIGGALLITFIGLMMIYRNHVHQLALNEMKTNFVSSVSHELRAPIASVRLMAENLQEGNVVGESKLKEYVGFIGQECRRLSSLIENVLDFSRIDQGRKSYEFEPTDLSKLVEDTVRLMKPYAEERHVELAIRMEGRYSCRPDVADARSDRANDSSPSARSDRNVADPIEINIDGRAIQQALINLIDNAIKHSPESETVTIQLEVEDQLVRIIVDDCGPGIPLEDQSKIFERFYRRGSELRRETQGIGIGLSIVKHIVDGHGGKVWVESEPGKGSRFIIELSSTAGRHR